MKILKYTVLAMFLATSFSTISCKKERTKEIMIGDYVPLQAELSNDLVMVGDELSYSISVVDPSSSGITLNEDINVGLEYVFSKDGNTLELNPSDVFENPIMSIPLERGIKAKYISLKLKKEISNAPLDVTIRAKSRGYQINGSSKLFKVFDKFYTSVTIKGSSDNAVDEGGKFILRASIPRPASQDIVVNVTPKSSDLYKFIDLPSNITIKQGFVSGESNIVKLNAFSGKNDFSDIALDFTTDNTEFPLLKDNLEVTVNDLDGELDPTKKLFDEHWVYPNPSQVFMSEQNEEAVSEWGQTRPLRLMMPGDAHPNPELAARGWKLVNAMEFTPISSLIKGGKPNQYDNRTCPFFAEQNVKNTQKVQFVDNDKYTNMTDDGYFVLWSAKDKGLTTGGVQGESRDYGVAAIYQNKYDGGNADTWQSSQIKILPGMRIEFRLRMRGDLWGFNPAVWLQGNRFRDDQWSYYGEVDILEAPFFANGGKGAWQTFHWNNDNTKSGDRWHPSSGSKNIALDEFNIYWVEWRSNNEIVIGINGQETVKLDNPSRYSWWPFTDTYNKDGMHLLITFPANNEWAFGKNGRTDWDKYLSKIPYEGSKTNPKTPRMEIDWIRYYKTDAYNYNPFSNGKSYMY